MIIAQKRPTLIDKLLDRLHHPLALILLLKGSGIRTFKEAILGISIGRGH